MMTNPVIHGDGLQDMKYRCQMPYIAYICALKGGRPDDFIPPNDRDKEICEDFNGINFIWTDQAKVSESIENHQLLATTNVPGQYHPRLISPQSSMGSLKKGKW